MDSSLSHTKETQNRESQLLYIEKDLSYNSPTSFPYKDTFNDSYFSTATETREIRYACEVFKFVSSVPATGSQERLGSTVRYNRSRGNTTPHRFVAYVNCGFPGNIYQTIYARRVIIRLISIDTRGDEQKPKTVCHSKRLKLQVDNSLSQQAQKFRKSLVISMCRLMSIVRGLVCLTNSNKLRGTTTKN